MPRFYLPPSAIRDKSFILTGSEAHHALDVLRKKAGDEIELFDGKDLSFLGRIDAVTGGEIRGTILDTHPARSLPLELILYQALTKGSKWEWLLEKAGEIGISRVVPVFTQRSLIKLDAAQGEEKVKRWNRIALAATKQCGRTDLMAVDFPVNLTSALSHLRPQALSLIPWEKESKTAIKDACQGFNGKEINVFIGPEGGWDAHEIELARQHQVIPVRLGPTLLRTETAGLVAATLVLREFGIY
jgi:16S rRNA (uracil1498-N3)-methyltransferase